MSSKFRVKCRFSSLSKISSLNFMDEKIWLERKNPEKDKSSVKLMLMDIPYR